MFDDLGLARCPNQTFNAAALRQRFARRDHLYLVAHANRLAAGIEQRLWWQPIVDRFVGPDVACRPVDAAVCRRERIEVFEHDHAFLPSTTSLKSQPLCLGISGTAMRPAD